MVVVFPKPKLKSKAARKGEGAVGKIIKPTKKSNTPVLKSNRLPKVVMPSGRTYQLHKQKRT